MWYPLSPAGNSLQDITKLSTNSINFTMLGTCFSFPSSQVISSPRILFSMNFCSSSEAVFPPLSCPSWKIPEVWSFFTSSNMFIASSSSNRSSITLIYSSFRELQTNAARLCESFLGGCGNFDFKFGVGNFWFGLQIGLWAFQCNFWHSLLQ